MVMRVALLVLVGCGGAGEQGEVVASTTMVLGEQTGIGPSPLDPLLGQSIGFDVEVANAVIAHATAEGCRWTVNTTEVPVATATGSNAALVQTEILDRLPAWDVKLALCDVAAQSSVTLHADFEGMAVIAGCLVVPASAQVRDGAGDPRWTDFTGASCQATVYDQLHGRLFTAHDVTMQFALAPR
jgi:hypothetical protein